MSRRPWPRAHLRIEPAEPGQGSDGRTACGWPANPTKWCAHDARDVTCQACKRTTAYRAALVTLALESAHG